MNGTRGCRLLTSFRPILPVPRYWLWSQTGNLNDLWLGPKKQPIKSMRPECSFFACTIVRNARPCSACLFQTAGYPGQAAILEAIRRTSKRHLNESLNGKISKKRRSVTRDARPDRRTRPLFAPKDSFMFNGMQSCPTMLLCSELWEAGRTPIPSGPVRLPSSLHYVRRVL